MLKYKVGEPGRNANAEKLHSNPAGDIKSPKESSQKELSIIE
jgi:hypothetical protein